MLAQVVTWCDKHKSIPERVETSDCDVAPERSADQEIEKWDEEYFKVDHGMLFDIIMAANYLDIPGLLDSSCKVVAAMMRGKTPEEIRVMFNITNDFTPEEEENIRKENAWCEE
ncbi:Skp1 family, dimerization domain protein [Ancylostoma caninum]|uniref:Skp1 family, dimerization domain protein n=1 Tax=Ancylostoma caninum TaxID=29170 RepID=A0A368G5E2_ANCCA|nr:Skp1 family, dimerization domain protein [Ancylostoma caninum]